ncbi:CdaR family protein [Maribacter sp.]|uniref:CdaR family protein n=1 Tax=Maribacter sp. TaxID=1897614 RepID=UPI0025C2C5EF|nr:CdaR family protein [Maribacter sp.]
MIQRIGKHLKKRKVKIFLVFLLVSSMAWFINKLSESYTSRATFKLSYINVPKGYLLKSASKESLEVKLEASGFQFLGFGFNAKDISIDISEASKKKSKFILSQKKIQKQVEKKLPNSIVLIDLDKEDVIFELVEIITKNVRVEVNIKMNLQKNCMLDGAILLEPKTIEVTGPTNEIDTLQSIKTKLVELKDIDENFSKTILTIEPSGLNNTTYNTNKVVISGKVSRFSEKMIENIPITIINLPKGAIVKTFPDRVKVLCKAKLGVLKTISENNFTVIADYKDMIEGNEKVTLNVGNVPNNVYSATLIEKEVTYIISEE